MSSRWFRALVLAAVVAGGTTQAVAAADVHIQGSFTQHFGGPSGGAPNGPSACPSGILNCGSGMVAGYGKATDAFAFDADDNLIYTITLSDGSSITSFLSFVDRLTPGRSGDAPGTRFSVGNPEDLLFDAEVASGTGRFAGAIGGGRLTLNQAGDVDQLSDSLDITLP